MTTSSQMVHLLVCLVNFGGVSSHTFRSVKEKLMNMSEEVTILETRVKSPNCIEPVAKAYNLFLEETYTQGRTRKKCIIATCSLVQLPKRPFNSDQ